MAALYLLEKGPADRIEAVGRVAAARALLRHILFFAHDRELVKRVFESAVEFVARVPVARLTFAPDERVWELWDERETTLRESSAVAARGAGRRDDDHVRPRIRRCST